MFLMYSYSLFLFHFTFKIFNPRLSKAKTLAIFPLIISTFYMVMIVNRVFLPLQYVLCMMLCILCFRIAYYDTIGNIFALCLNSAYSLLLFRGLYLAIVSWVLKESLYQVSQRNIHYVLSFGISQFFLLMLGILFEKKIKATLVGALLRHKNMLLSVMTIKIIFVLFMVSGDYMVYYQVDDIALLPGFLMNRILIYACYYLLLVITLKSGKWVDNEMEHELMRMQLEYQKQLYKKRNQFEEVVRMYNHDYKNILQNAVSCIENDQLESAKNLLTQLGGQVTSLIDKNKRNSNSLIVDIILSTLEEKCNKSGIEFSSNCYIPENVKISELQFSRIFNNLANNTFEACDKQKESEKRWITFKSYVKDGNLIIYVQNSFNGIVRYEKEKLATTKRDQKMHGIGLDSIRHTVEELNGMVIVKPDQEKKIFEQLIKIPAK